MSQLVTDVKRLHLSQCSAECAVVAGVRSREVHSLFGTAAAGDASAAVRPDCALCSRTHCGDLHGWSSCAAFCATY